MAGVFEPAKRKDAEFGAGSDPVGAGEHRRKSICEQYGVVYYTLVTGKTIYTPVVYPH